MLFAFALGDGPVSVWDCTDLTTDMPAALRDALADPHILVFAHNSSFDRTVMRHAMPHQTPPIPRWRDTMVQAFAHGLPGALGTLCDILKVPTDKSKDKEGRKFIQLFCKPRPTSSKLRRATRETHPAEWARFVEYAALDIHAMREVHKRLPTWNYSGSELALWHLDQTINDRGVAIDMDLVRGAIAAVDIAQADLAERTATMTDGQLASTTQRNATLNYIADTHGVLVDDLQMATVERMVNDSETAPELRALLEIRLQASTSSTSKYKALLKGANSDDRIRGLLQFDGASRTGRWCIAEGSLVTTLGFDGVVRETPIEHVNDDDLVWDGDKWVPHEGVVFSGVKDVIYHDGVLATAEHNVYTTTSGYTTLAQAKEQGLAIWHGNAFTQFID
jgi:DNA polymerase